MSCPTADEVARAIVAACKETEEDPFRCATAIAGSRARHYALHALAFFYPPQGREDKELLARVVGCPGKPLMFWSNSNTQVFRPCVIKAYGGQVTHTYPHWARWFDDEAFARVKAAIRPTSRERVVCSTPLKPAAIEAEFPKATLSERVNTPLTMRRKPARCFDDVTATLMGDPPLERSALSKANLQ